MFDVNEEGLSIVRYEGDFDAVPLGKDALKPFEFIDEPTVICDLSRIISRVRLWQEKLSRVTLYYPVKCNSDPLVLRVLERVGVKFSCASKDEIRAMRVRGVSADDILFASPVKIISHLRCAEKQRVGLLVVDCLDELEKVKMYHPDAKLLLKIKFKAGQDTSTASGCEQQTDALKLMMEAKNMDLNLCGISFDNATHTFDTDHYKAMLISTRSLFDYGKGILGLGLNTICIGGGIPATIDSDTFSHFSAVISKIIAEFFPEPSIRVMAEPGDFLVGPSMTMFCTIQARREVLDGEGDIREMIYYLNYSCADDDSWVPRVVADIETELQEDNKVVPSVIMGAMNHRYDTAQPTTKTALLPLQFVGDILCFENCGARQMVSNSGFRPPIVKYYLKQSCKIIL